MIFVSTWQARSSNTIYQLLVRLDLLQGDSLPNDEPASGDELLDFPVRLLKLLRLAFLQDLGDNRLGGYADNHPGFDELEQ